MIQELWQQDDRGQKADILGFLQGLVDDVRAAGGVLSLEDLTSAEALVKEPLRAQVGPVSKLAMATFQRGTNTLTGLPFTCLD